MRKYLILASAVFTWLFSAPELAARQYNNELTLAFYNVENLFDTLDNPLKNDVEFTPDSEKRWGTERYLQKISALSLVVQELGFPDILGLCEVENEQVLNDWASYERMEPHGYRFIIGESPDRRGINVALMYKPSRFNLIAYRFIYPDFSDTDRPDMASRDILYAVGTLPSGDTLHLFINHWPSRFGGQQNTEPYRKAAARSLKAMTDSLYTVYPSPFIAIMGDFNDNPFDASVQQVLDACHPESKRMCRLINPFWPLHEAGLWSYNFRGQLNMLDQIILSRSFYHRTEGLRFRYANVYNGLWLMYHHHEHGFMPNRTFSGSAYTGGFSDHLPVYVKLSY